MRLPESLGGRVKKKAKKRPGRPSAAGGRVKFTTTLPPDVLKWLREFDEDGNVSAAITVLVRAKMTLQVNQTSNGGK